MKRSELRPSLLFLGKFIGFYLIVSFLYGWWVTAYEPRPDPATQLAARQSAVILRWFGYPVSTEAHSTSPAERVLLKNHSILSVYEGCNGINVWIIFAGFMLALGKPGLRLAGFVLCGSVVIYVLNLGRILALFFISLSYPEAVYFVHKYLFTALLYGAVFGMWYFWISYHGRRRTTAN
jgi:exosortase family protein XrtF